VATLNKNLLFLIGILCNNNGRASVNFLIIDAVHSSIQEELGKYMQVDTKMLPTQEELAAIIGEYDVLIMRVDPAINKDILDAASNLKVIGVCSVGLNHIDMDTAKAKNIQVFNAPGLNDNAVAELTIAKMLEISRHTIPACIDVKVNKTWDKYKFMGRELRGKTLGILGFGRVGQRVGKLAHAFQMEVVAYDPYLPAYVFDQEQSKSVSVEELLKVSDFVSIHMPLTPETKNLVNAQSIATIRDRASPPPCSSATRSSLPPTWAPRPWTPRRRLARTSSAR